MTSRQKNETAAREGPLENEAPRPRGAWLFFAAIALIAAFAWANSAGGVFVFDDLAAIRGSQTAGEGIKAALGMATERLTTSGRPVVALTIWCNRQLGGENPFGYHLFNLVAHITAGCLLFALARRTLGKALLKEREADLAAAAIAALWVVHPLQTAAVTYVVQRAEVLAGVFTLLTLYGVARAATSADEKRGGWCVLAWCACLAGMGSKETAAAAPLLAIVYDRVFFAGSWRGVWENRKKLHAGLCAMWLPLGLLVGATAGRGGTVGYDSTQAAWQYLLTQTEALWLYLRLAVWPSPLVFDYGMRLAGSLGEVALPATGVVVLLAATLWALVKRPAAGFLGTWFFLTLAPSTSVVPILTQTMAEHRMYLPLAAVVAAAVCGGWSLVGRRILWVVPLLLVAFGMTTYGRNEAYRSERRLWEDTVAKRPENVRAHNNLGAALMAEGKLAEAVACLDRSLARQPGQVPARYNLGLALLTMGRADEALVQFREVLLLDPEYGEAHGSLAKALVRLGRGGEALVHFEAAVRYAPDWVEARFGLGNAYAQAGRFGEAERQYRAVVAAEPGNPLARANLGNVLLVTGRAAEAIAQYEEVLRARPEDGAVRENLAQARRMLGAERGR